MLIPSIGSKRVVVVVESLLVVFQAVCLQAVVVPVVSVLEVTALPQVPMGR